MNFPHYFCLFNIITLNSSDHLELICPIHTICLHLTIHIIALTYLFPIRNICPLDRHHTGQLMTGWFSHCTSLVYMGTGHPQWFQVGSSNL